MPVGLPVGLALEDWTGDARFHEYTRAANPVVVGDKVLITECYEKGSALLKISPEWKVEEVWTDADKDTFEKSLMAHWNTPIHDSGFVYGSSGRHAPEGDLRCVELANGICTLKGITSVGVKQAKVSPTTLSALGVSREDLLVLANDLDTELQRSAELFSM